MGDLFDAFEQLDVSVAVGEHADSGQTLVVLIGDEGIELELDAPGPRHHLGIDENSRVAAADLDGYCALDVIGGDGHEAQVEDGAEG